MLASVKISSTTLPRISSRGRPMKRSAEALTSTTWVSLVNSTRPSCRVPMIWSRFPFRALKTSLTSRIWRPRRSILVLTRLYSSTRPGSGCGLRVGHLRRHLVQPPPNRLQRAQRDVGHTRSQRQRKQDGECRDKSAPALTAAALRFAGTQVEIPTRMFPKRWPSPR